jgi:hypothetical protein
MKDLIIKILKEHSTYLDRSRSYEGIYDEQFDYVADALMKQCIIHGVINWVAYDWNNPSTRPPKAGRYLIYRSNCDKLHFEQWNGSGWSSSNNDCTHWTLIKPPCL